MAKGYSLDALVNVVYPANRGSLTSSQNLNDLVGSDNYGIYFQASSANATLALNYPTTLAGTLEVLPSTGTDNVVQRYTEYTGSNAQWTRSRYGGSWSVWSKYIPISDIFNAIYPVGIITMFEKSVDPNTLFPGTTWYQRVSGRSIRAAGSNVEGTAPGQIGSLQGDNTYTLTISNMPAHNHTIAQHTHPMTHAHTIPAHTHTVPAHSHTMAHTHTINHDHGVATAASAGAHTHTQDVFGHNGSGNYSNFACGDSTNNSGIGSPTATTASAGAHTHVVDIPVFNGNSGASSAASTGNSAVLTSGGTALTTDASPTVNTGGNTAALTTGQNGDGAAFSTISSSVYYAVWARAA